MKKKLNIEKHEELYADDLLEWVGIPRNENEKLWEELSRLFGQYSKEEISSVYEDIMFKCQTPNGQMRGTLPLLQDIKEILRRAKHRRTDIVKTHHGYTMLCPKCGSAYPMDQYRCFDGYIIEPIGGGYTQAIPCRDTNDPKVGPLLEKHKLETIPPELLGKKN